MVMAKFTIVLKDPDFTTHGLTRSEFNSSEELVNATKLRDSFLEWGEYITVEFDTGTKSARVLTPQESRSGYVPAN